MKKVLSSFMTLSFSLSAFAGGGTIGSSGLVDTYSQLNTQAYTIIRNLPDKTKFVINQKVLLLHKTHYKSFVNVAVTINNIKTQLECGFKYREARTQDRVVDLASLTIAEQKLSFSSEGELGRHNYYYGALDDKAFNAATHHIEFSFSDSDIKIECSSTKTTPAELKIIAFTEILQKANIKLKQPPAIPMKISSAKKKITDDDFTSDEDSLYSIRSGSQIVITKPLFFYPSFVGSYHVKVKNSYCAFLHEIIFDNRILLPGIYTVLQGGVSKSNIINLYSNPNVLTLSETVGSELHISCGEGITVGDFREFLLQAGMELLRAGDTQ